MSKYNYPNWHEIKDLVSIYREYEWDNAEVVVWNPEEQRKYNLIFCGSSRPGVDGNERGKIHFIIRPLDDRAEI